MGVIPVTCHVSRGYNCHVPRHLQLALGGAPAECPHDLAELHRGDGAAAVPEHTAQVKLSTSLQMSCLMPNEVKNVIHKVS